MFFRKKARSRKTIYQIIATLWPHTHTDIIKGFDIIKIKMRQTTTQQRRTSGIGNAPQQGRRTDNEAHHQTAVLIRNWYLFSSPPVLLVYSQKPYLQKIQQTALFSQPQYRQLPSDYALSLPIGTFSPISDFITHLSYAHHTSFRRTESSSIRPAASLAISSTAISIPSNQSTSYQTTEHSAPCPSRARPKAPVTSSAYSSTTFTASLK